MPLRVGVTSKQTAIEEERIQEDMQGTEDRACDAHVRARQLCSDDIPFDRSSRYYQIRSPLSQGSQVRIIL